MKLARKFALVLTLAITVVLALESRSSVLRDLGLFDRRMKQDHLLVGRAVAGAMATVWRVHGEAAARAVLADAGQGEGAVRLRLVWLDEPRGAPTGPALDVASVPTPPSFVSRTPERLLTYVTVDGGAGRPAALEVSESLAGQHDYVRGRVTRALATTALMVLLCAGMIVGLGVFFVGRPVRALVHQARRVGAGDLSARAQVRQRDEIGELADEMNAMCRDLTEAHAALVAETSRRVATLEQLRHADRLNTVGKLASGMAHELGTPLNVVTARAKMIARGEVVGDRAREGARIIAEQAERMTKITRDLLDFARRRGPRRAPTDLGLLVERTVSMLAELAERRRVTVAVTSDVASVMADVDPDQMQQVVMNLVVNALHAMEQPGSVSIRLSSERATPPADDGRPTLECIRLTVEDQGRGIPPDVIEHVFEPFYTTKDVGEGTGLGLSVSYGIVKEHGGWIDVESNVSEGTRFSVLLPIGAAPGERAL